MTDRRRQRPRHNRQRRRRFARRAVRAEVLELAELHPWWRPRGSWRQMRAELRRQRQDGP